MMRRLSAVLACVVLAVAVSSALAAGYRTSVGSGADLIPVVVVSGTPYEMGFAYGQLMQAEVASCMDGYLATAQAEDPVRNSDAALDAAWATVEPYVNARFIEEMQGVADGAGVSYDLLRRAHSISIQGNYSCSGVALWGPASRDRHLYQIRNLDYTTNAGLQDYPVIVVYIPNTGIAHACPAFAGFVGAVAGMNASGITLTEKGATPGSDYPFDLNGVPFFAMARDILQDAATLEQSLAIVQNASRIKKYYYVIGDGRQLKGVKIRAFAPYLDIWADNDPTDEVAPNVRANLVYVTMDDATAWSHFNANYGRYNSARMIELSRLVSSPGGNLMNVVYDATARLMWVAYAEGATDASQRAYVVFKLDNYLRKPRTR